MFERLCIRPTGTIGIEPHLDLGLLAEGLLFYGKVHLVANRGVLTELVQHLGPDLTLRLAEQDRISISYNNRFSAAYTEDSGTSMERHLLTVAEMPHTAVDNIAPELFRAATGKSGRGNRLASRFLRRVERIDLDESVASSAQEDAQDPSYVSSAAEAMLSSLVPDYALPPDFHFELENLPENRFRIHTNLDLPAVTQAFHKSSGSDVMISPALLASYLVSIHEALAYAARFGSDITTSQIESRLLKLKLASLLQHSERSEGQIAEFEEFVFGRSRAIAEAVRSGHVSFSQLLDVVERSTRFRHWLDGKAPDADLVHEYFAECTRESWVDQLPVATARWALVGSSAAAAGALVVGPVGVAVGLAIGSADFVIDRIRKGWKPNHFVERRLRRLTE